MADTFSINVITSDGAALIAQATATNQIVFTQALSASVAATDAADLASKPVSWYDGITGAIGSCSATDNVAKITTRFNNAGATAQDVKSVAIMGRLASGGTEVIVAAMSDPASEITLPSNQSPHQIIRFIFKFAVNADSQVETVYADGATIADLERFVSLHKAGDPTVGEAQTILGDKSFNGKIIVKNGLYSSGTNDIGEPNHRFSDAWINSLYANNIGAFTLNGNISIAPNSFIEIGSSANKVDAIYADTINAYSYFFTDYISANSGDITTLSSTNGTFTTVIASKVSGDTDQGFCYIGSDLIPDTTNAHSLGSSAKTFKDLYVYDAHVGGTVSCTTISATLFSGLLTSLYDPSNGVGSLAEIEIKNETDTTDISIVRGDVVEDGATVGGKVVSVKIDASTAPGKWALLNAKTIIQGGSKVMAVRTE